MSRWWSDLRQALRLITRHPGFSLFGILTLATGIGAATAVFTLVNTVLLRALPFANPDQLVWMYNARTERDRAPFSIPDLQDYERGATTLQGLAMFTNWTANLTGAGDAERLEGVRVAGHFFELVGTPAFLGRTLEARDESEGSRSVVLTYGLWKRRFGGDAGLVGNLVTLNGASYTVVGVLPEGFVFPFRDAEIAVPVTFRDDPRRTDRGANFVRVVARLQPGVTIRQAKADLDTIARRLQRAFPEDDARKIGVSLYPLQAEIVSDYRQILWTVFAAVAVLLLIGSGNLANLLLVRASGRRAELSMRLYLGASRGQIVSLLVSEAAVLALFGAMFGVAAAYWAIEGWRAFGPANFPRMTDVVVDRRVLLFAGLSTVAIVLVSGVIPALVISRDLKSALGAKTRSITGTRQHGWARRGFVMLQVAGSTILLVAMGLIARGFANLEQVDPGFTSDRALSIQLSLPPARYPTGERIAVFHDALRDRLATVPGVRAVGAVSLLPLSGLLNTMDIGFPGRPAPPPEEVPQAHFRIAGPGYMEAAGIRVLDGRELSVHDSASGKLVALVSRTFAERHWPGESAVGKQLQVLAPGSTPIFEVVGEVNDVKQFTLDGAATADVYVPLHQMPASQTSLLTARQYWVIRTHADPRSLEQAFRNAVHAVDPDVATSSVRTLDEVVSSSLSARRVNVRLLTVFGQVALVLSAIGVYAIATFSAGARKRELAIRSVCGATRLDLTRLVLRDELPTIAMGLGAGLTGALFVGRWLGNALFSVSSADPFTYGAVSVGLLAVATAATYVPAWRAGRVEPNELLKG
jgi:predicted permease